MIFITIIIALAIEILVDHPQRMRNMSWLMTYRNWVVKLFGKSTSWNGVVGVLGVVAIPLVILKIIQSTSTFSDLMYGFFGILLGVLVLIYCLRYRAMYQLVDELSVDSKNAITQMQLKTLAQELLGETQVSKDPNRTLTEQVIIQANERLFAVIFWFVIFGPMGALMYRMAWYLKDNPLSLPDSHSAGADATDDAEDNFNSAAVKLYAILSWIPARLTAFAYALAGGFEDAFGSWKEPGFSEEYNIIQSNHSILKGTGLGALRLSRYETGVVQSEDDEGQEPQSIVEIEAVKAAGALVLRSLLMWCALLAIVVLTVWSSS